MTHQEFWELYDSGKISIKVFSGSNKNNVVKEVEAFSYSGKCWLRLHTRCDYVTGERRFGKRYRMSDTWDAIKEFNSKESANKYFKKFFEDCEGYERIHQ